MTSPSPPADLPAGLAQVTLVSDPAVQNIPLGENGELLVDVGTLNEERLRTDSRLAEAGEFRFMVREGVLHRLRRAAAALPQGWNIALVEGYRSRDYQERVYTEYLDALRSGNPSWDEDYVRTMATRFASSPEAVAPHSTGGAVDILLVDDDGREVDVGAEINETPEHSNGRCFTDAPLPPAARRNRNVLVMAMSGAGMVNYPTEWWHWSFGEQYWAFATAAEKTLYSPVRPEDRLGRLSSAPGALAPGQTLTDPRIRKREDHVHE